MTAPILPVVDQISAALSVSNLRHEVIASNIANRDSQGYQRLKVRFDQAMSGGESATVVNDYSAADVSLEQDLVALSSNTLRYESLARALRGYFALIATITSPNRG
jgi:flagellar basal-body rod protein FlgB